MRSVDVAILALLILWGFPASTCAQIPSLALEISLMLGGQKQGAT